MQPVGQGLVGEDGEEVSRGRYVFVSLLYPESRISNWFDGGRLPAGFSDRIPIAIGTLLWLAVGTAIGLPLVRPVFPSSPFWSVRVEQLCMASLVGLALLSTTVLLVGLFGGLQSKFLFCAAIVFLATTVYTVSRSSHEIRSDTQESEVAITKNHASSLAYRNRLDWLFLFAIVVMTVFAGVVVMLGAWLPPSEFDVLEYHLQAPKEFFQKGQIRFVPHNIYANMPLGIEMHSLAMMTLVGQHDAWLGGLIGKSITASISIIGAALLGAFLTRMFGSLVGWTAAGLWLSSPGIANVAVFGLIDGALATYVLAAAIAVCGAFDGLAQRNRELTEHSLSTLSKQRQRTYWRLAAVMAGAAAAAKYPGLILAVVPTCAAFAWAIWRYRSVFVKREIVVIVALIAIELAATCGPWYAKNLVFAHNPVYPLAARWFGGKTLTPEKIEQWNRAHQAKSFAQASSQGTASATPLSSSMQDALRPILTSILVQPSIIIGVLLCLFAIPMLRSEDRNQLAMIWLGWSVWIFLVWWFATHRIDRFWLPLTGLWAGLAAIGFWWLHKSVWRWLSLTMVVLGLGYGCVINSSPIVGDNRYFVSIAALRLDIGDDRQVPRVSPPLAWINKHLDQQEVRILLIGEARAFDFLAPIEYSTCFDLNPGEDYLRAQTVEEQSANLEKNGITHIMIQWAEINRYRHPGNYGFSDWPQPADVQKLVDDAVVTRVEWGFPQEVAELFEVLR